MTDRERRIVYEHLLESSHFGKLPLCAIDQAATLFGLHRNTHEIETAVRAVPHIKRQTLRSLAAAVGIPKTTLLRHKRDHAKFSYKSNWLRPRLTPTDMNTRLDFAMSFIRPGVGDRHSFCNMYNIVHVDEK
ncbi:hypothetical protein ACHHYP_14041 [Achlya hypogyna]|uniref:Uncharacterized protein n=1 Tax=Achlya hypogyna TaxID=1202772 RepID=A0A1V9YE54_ACHHY|nr:hypothetical protein ACHHYP_14041 [Achlya hypogyna]